AAESSMCDPASTAAYGGHVSLSSSVPGFTRNRLTLVLAALVLAVFMASIETSIIATALPTITGEFNAFESYAWVGTVYIVTATIATPLLGKLSDLYGRRLVFQSALMIFIVGSILCGASQSIEQLIASRAVQGLGGGAIQALAFAILGDILPPRERGRYIGYFTLSFVGAALLGPLAGGFIVEHYSWPWIFYVNVPLALVVAGVCHVALRLPFPRRKAKLDYAGAALLSASIACLMVALEEGRHGWTNGLVILLLALAIIALVAFIAAERRAAEPIIPLRLFANPVVLASVTMGFCAGVFVYGAGQFLPLYFQDSLFVSPTESGLRLLPQMVGVTIGTFGIGRLIARSGRYKVYPMVGTVLAVIGLLCIAQISGTTTYTWLIVPMMFAGFGVSSVFTTTSIAAQNAVEFHDLGVATATLMFFRSLGGSFGLAIFGTVLNATVRSEIPSRIGVTADEAGGLIRSPAEIQMLPPSFRLAVVDSVALGVSRIYWIAAAVMLGAVIVAALLPEWPLRLRAGLSDALEEGAVA
ncbi:MAG: MDR family MFS transporter, partial [Ilumatobacteraceae bacterium]